jgi:hypothetical protein
MEMMEMMVLRELGMEMMGLGMEIGDGDDGIEGNKVWGLGDGDDGKGC